MKFKPGDILIIKGKAINHYKTLKILGIKFRLNGNHLYKLRGTSIKLDGEKRINNLSMIYTHVDKNYSLSLKSVLKKL